MLVECEKFLHDHGTSYNLYDISHLLFSNNSFLDLLLRHKTITVEELRNIRDKPIWRWKMETFKKTMMKKGDSDFLIFAMTLKNCHYELIQSIGETMWSGISKMITSHGNTEVRERIEREMKRVELLHLKFSFCLLKSIVAKHTHPLFLDEEDMDCKSWHKRWHVELVRLLLEEGGRNIMVTDTEKYSNMKLIYILLRAFKSVYFENCLPQEFSKVTKKTELVVFNLGTKNSFSHVQELIRRIQSGIIVNNARRKGYVLLDTYPNVLVFSDLHTIHMNVDDIDVTIISKNELNRSK